MDAFDGYANTLILSGGDNFIPGPFLSAGSDPSLNAVVGATSIARPDIAIHNAIGVQASGIGNHEWDLGSNVYADALRSSGTWPGLSSSACPPIWILPATALSAPWPTPRSAELRPMPLRARKRPSSGQDRSLRRCDDDGQKIGLVGATTQLIEGISSPSETEVKGFPNGPGPNGEKDDMDLLAAQLQPVIDNLIAQGLNKIVLISHLQQITNEQLLATKLKGSTSFSPPARTPAR